jgi:hypothetical protein
MSKKEDAIVKVEQEALEQWQKKREQHLTLDQSMALYEHYLNGHSVEEIFHLKNGKIPFGQIVDAKQRYEWDRRKNTQLSNLYKKVEERAVKAKADAVFLLTDALAIAKKQLGDRFRKYMETGDESHLGTLDLANLKNYKMILEMLQLLTEQNKNQKEVSVGGVVTHQHNVSVDSVKASDLLRLFDEGKIIDGEKK